MPKRKERPVERPAPHRPDRDHVRRLVVTLLSQGVGVFPTAEWRELADLVSVPEAHAPLLVYGFRIGSLPTDDPDRLADLLLAEFDETVAGTTPADL